MTAGDRATSLPHHAPTGYDCPFCRLARGEETGKSSPADVIYQDDQVMALVPIDWRPQNKVHVLVVPVAHYENVFDLPPELGTPLQYLIRDVALAMKIGFACTGITVRQNNEPDGRQDVWHHHTHVVARFPHDQMELSRLIPNTAAERSPIVTTLRDHMAAMRDARSNQ
jgi:histidine triad (HIT) family protein